MERKEKLDYSVVYENIIKGIKNYCDVNRIKTLVLGISGGIDSTVTAALAKASGIRLVGISLPCSTNKDDEVTAASLVGEEFCDSFKEISIQGAFECVEKMCTEASGKESTPISQGNIKARLRMITLYDIASKEGGIVLDTDNTTENLLGFYTIHGDVGDFNPIGELWKHEVYGLAKWMNENVYKDSKALEASIALIPTDGNGVKEGGDLAQIAEGKTYDDVDEILDTKLNHTETYEAICEKHGEDTVKKVYERSDNSEFKRKHRPFIIDISSGDTLEKNGKPYLICK